MATTIVVPSASDIGAFAPDVADDYVLEKGSYDPRLAQKVIDIATAASTDINALQAGTSIAVATSGVTGTIRLGGDLAGTGSSATAPRTSGINSTTVGAGGALTTGAVLRATGASAAAWGTVDLANVAAVTGVLPGANQALAVAGVSQGAVSAAQATAIDAALPVSKKTLTADHTTITTAGASQAINIGTALPANARIVGVDLHTYTAFSGGTVGDFTVDIGTAGDVDALIDGADLFAAAVDGGPATIPKGIRPNKSLSAAQLIATFMCGSDDVADATAGAITIDVLYTVLA